MTGDLLGVNELQGGRPQSLLQSETCQSRMKLMADGRVAVLPAVLVPKP